MKLMDQVFNTANPQRVQAERIGNVDCIAFRLPPTAIQLTGLAEESTALACNLIMQLIDQDSDTSRKGLARTHWHHGELHCFRGDFRIAQRNNACNRSSNTHQHSINSRKETHGSGKAWAVQGQSARPKANAVRKGTAPVCNLLSTCKEPTS